MILKLFKFSATSATSNKTATTHFIHFLNDRFDFLKVMFYFIDNFKHLIISFNR